MSGPIIYDSVSGTSLDRIHQTGDIFGFLPTGSTSLAPLSNTCSTIIISDLKDQDPSGILEPYSGNYNIDNLIASGILKQKVYKMTTNNYNSGEYRVYINDQWWNLSTLPSGYVKDSLCNVTGKFRSYSSVNTYDSNYKPLR